MASWLLVLVVLLAIVLGTIKIDSWLWGEARGLNRKPSPLPVSTGSGGTPTTDSQMIPVGDLQLVCGMRLWRGQFCNRRAELVWMLKSGHHSIMEATPVCVDHHKPDTPVGHYLSEVTPEQGRILQSLQAARQGDLG